MKDFLFFSGIAGFAFSLAILAVGNPWRRILSWVDEKLFPHRWAEDLPTSQRGGAIRVFAFCPACISFWTAMAVSAFIYSPSRVHIVGIQFIPGLLLDGFATVGIIWTVHVTLTRLGQYEL